MTSPFRPLTQDVAVAPQIALADLKAAAEAGYRTIVSNRPDGEDPGQPTAAEVAAEAEANGLAFVHLPFQGTNMTPDQVKALAGLLAAPETGKVLAFCRSGTRSSIIYSAAAVANGKPLPEVIGDAAKGGYDLAPHAPLIKALADAAR